MKQDTRLKVGLGSRDSQTVRVTIPRDIARQIASRYGVTIKELAEHFLAEYRYSDFEGVYVKFAPKDGNK